MSNLSGVDIILERFNNSDSVTENIVIVDCKFKKYHSNQLIHISRNMFNV